MTVITKRKQDIGPDKLSIGTKVCVLIAVPTLAVSVLMLCYADARMRQFCAKKLLSRSFAHSSVEDEAEPENDWGDELEKLEGEL